MSEKSASTRRYHASDSYTAKCHQRALLEVRFVPSVGWENLGEAVLAIGRGGDDNDTSSDVVAVDKVLCEQVFINPAGTMSVAMQLLLWLGWVCDSAFLVSRRRSACRCRRRRCCTLAGDGGGIHVANSSVSESDA